MNVQEKTYKLALQAQKVKEDLLQGKNVYHYPWHNLKKEILLFGYGSLIHPDSAALTLDSSKSSFPALGFGVERIFNFDRPLKFYKEKPKNPKERANLNVRISTNLTNVINGIVKKISLEEIKPLRKREITYDLVPIVTCSWDALSKGEKPSFFVSHILRAPENKNFDILPYSPYYEMTRKGAELLGKDFLKVWLKTTFLADGVTTVEDWEKGRS